MFAYLKGTLVAAHASHVIVDVQGIGYYLLIPCRLLGDLPALGEAVQLHTSFVVREFSQTLYGFLSSQERDIFEVLLNVTGIGPKLALSLIGHLSLSELQDSVINQDVSTLCRVPGVGKKTAERLIVELKDKMPSLACLELTEVVPAVHNAKTKSIKDAMLALINLGYNQTTAQKAIKKGLKELPETEEIDLPELITIALRNV